MSRRRLDWNQVLGELKADRLALKPVREERLRPAQGLRGAPALALSAWRGQSSRRYVVGVHRIEAFEAAEAEQAVTLFVARDLSGVASLVFGARDLDALDVSHMVERARAAGCTEVHVHRLADDPAERIAILDDLNAPVMEAA